MRNKPKRNIPVITGYQAKYGILGWIAVAAVVAKVFFFYSLIQLTSYYVLIPVITCALILIIFLTFRHKWIPAALYLLISVLMFADVTYNAFFDKYISLSMFSAAEMLGDVTDSVWEVLQPEFLLMIPDALFIILLLIIKRKKKSPYKIAVTMDTPDRSTRNKKAGMPLIARIAMSLATMLIIAFFIWNPFGSKDIRMITYQDMLLYHTNDIALTLIVGEDYHVGSFSREDALEMINDDWYQEEKNGPLFGVAKDRNLFIIQIESFQDYVIDYFYDDQEITPFLNDFVKNESSIYFDNYYQENGSGNTSDAEFAANNSIVGSLESYTYDLYTENTFRGLPVLLGEKGYDTSVFHAYRKDFWNREVFYPVEGFGHFMGGTTDEGGDYELDEKIGMGLSDESFYRQSVEYMAENMSEPMYSFMVTLSNHHPFKLPKGEELIEIKEDHQGLLPAEYFNTVAYTDYTLEKFIEDLKENDLYDNSIIVMYGDHHGIAMDNKDSFEYVMDEEFRYDVMMNVPLIIHIPGTNINQTVSTAGGHIDLMPTLAYLMGFEELDTLYLGHNLLAIDEGFVGEQTYMLRGSFFTNDTGYSLGKDYVFENGKAWSTVTGKQKKLTKDIKAGYDRSLTLMGASDLILENDMLKSYTDRD